MGKRNDKTIQSKISRKTLIGCVAVSLLGMSSTGLACTVSMSQQRVELSNFDTFSYGSQQFHKPLRIELDGQCSGNLVYSFDKPLTAEDDLAPRVYVNSGNKSLYNTTAGKRSSSSSGIVSGDTESLIPLSMLVESSEVIESGLVSHPVTMKLDVLNEEGTSVLASGPVKKQLEFVVDVDRQINARFVGTNVDGLAQSMRLNLGNLNGNPSGNVKFSVQANVKYDVRVSSKNRGRLVIDDHENRWNNELPYVLDIDGHTMNLVGGGDTLEDQAFSKNKEGKTHRLGVYVLGDARKVRAGTYKDLLSIEVVPGL